MPTLRPFRNIDEKDVVNRYAFSGTYPQNKGILVALTGSGWVTSTDPTEMLGSPGAAFGNTVSQRYGVTAKCVLAETGDSVVGMTIWDLKETDENGEQLKFNPRKAAEIEACLSGQAVPMVRRGEFLYSGITGTVAVGQDLYAGAAGTIEADVLGAAASGDSANATKVGQALGLKDPNGWTLIYLDIR